MGNAVSTLSPLYLSEEVSWKTGIIPHGIPAPQTSETTTFGELSGSSTLKDFLYRHIDNDLLISSVLSGADDPTALVRNVLKFQAADPDVVSATQAAISNVQLCVAAGLDVSIMLLATRYRSLMCVVSCLPTGSRPQLDYLSRETN
jgi:hypothetical protein